MRSTMCSPRIRFNSRSKASRDAQRGASAPPAFHLGERGSKSALFEMQWNPFLDTDLIQRRSNELNKPGKYKWKRELFVYLYEI